MTAASLSPQLVRAALRLAGARPDEWLCPVCGAVVADDSLDGDQVQPIHVHRGRRVALVPRAQL